MIMRALGEPEQLELAELPDPEVGPGQVGIEVQACGCNFADLLLCRGKYQLRPALPFSPGSEVAGRVYALGAAVSGLTIGQNVAAQLGYGGYATRVAADVRRVQAMPEGMAFADACALGVAYHTAYLALHDRARLRAGESLLVHAAAGGVGLAAVELGVALGARVIASASSDDKLELCKRRGAHEALNTSGDGWAERVRKLTQGRGADVIYDSVGGELFEQSLKCIAWGGRLLVIGFSSGDIPKVALNRVMLKHISIVGLNLGGYAQQDQTKLRDASAELFALYARGALRPLVDARFVLGDAAKALAELGSRRSVGKLVLRVQ
jgi:NADPH2:quinone reductase